MGGWALSWPCVGERQWQYAHARVNASRSQVMFTYVLLGAMFISCCLQEYSCNADQDMSNPWRKLKTKQKRQVADDLCRLPGPELANGRYRTHPRRCPADDNSAACRLVADTWVTWGWVLLYDCDPGYRLDSFLSRRASVCQRRPGGGQWLPPLPRCIESSYNSRILPSKQICGKPAQNTRAKRSTKPKIHGVISQRGSWPWMVIFGHNKTKADGSRAGIHWFCAGTLVTQRHVLTAANCIAHHRNRPTYLARLDDLNLDDDTDEGIEILINSKTDVRIHPGFQPNTYFADNIAIVRLRRELQITEFIRPICLPTPDFENRIFSGKTAYVASWGQEDQEPRRQRPFQPILREVRAKAVNHDDCKTNYSDFQQSDTPFVISDGIICARLNISKRCQEDIGSPLMVESEGTYTLLGIVATKDVCAEQHFPRMFTKVSLYMSWIIVNLF